MDKPGQKPSYHHLSVEQILAMMKVDPSYGLTARQIVIEQFKSMAIIVLVVTAAVAFALQQWAEGIAIVAVLCVNAVLGFATEWKAMRSMQALQEKGGDRSLVRRSGEELEIDSVELVPGDIVVLEAGNIAPADIRLTESNSLRVNEAALTGESVPVRKEAGAVEKDAPLAERTSILYKGTTITEGSGKEVGLAGGARHERRAVYFRTGTASYSKSSLEMI
jgi:P-type Ca2+ transporter type 2C